MTTPGPSPAPQPAAPTPTTPAPTALTPAAAWKQLTAGNARFVSGQPMHPGQDAARRKQIEASQHPFAVVFGCSDSRVAAELVFDQGLGDLFVVRTAGHVLDTTVIGSIEYGVGVLGASLVVVLGHDSCGAVDAAFHALRTGEQPPGFVRAITDRVLPSLVAITAQGVDALRDVTAADLGREHVRHTCDMLHGYSVTLANAVAQGRCAIVGVDYALRDGTASLIEAIGDI